MAPRLIYSLKSTERDKDLYRFKELGKCLICGPFLSTRFTFLYIHHLAGLSNGFGDAAYRQCLEGKLVLCSHVRVGIIYPYSVPHGSNGFRVFGLWSFYGLNLEG